MTKFAKFYAAATAAGVLTIKAVWDRSLDQGEAVELFTVWAGAFGVFVLPNEDPAD